MMIRIGIFMYKLERDENAKEFLESSVDGNSLRESERTITTRVQLLSFLNWFQHMFLDLMKLFTSKRKKLDPTY